MDVVLFNALIATFTISLLALVGVFGILIKDKIIKKIAMILVAFSTGALLGGAFFHLLPESGLVESKLEPYVYLVFGIVIFYLLERVLKWHHCHDENAERHTHTFAYMSLIGDGLHNFIDGLIIVSSYSLSPSIGLATTIALASHEIPQELGDFGILIHGGFDKKKAILWNFLSALTSMLGVIIGYFMINNISNMSQFLLPFAAGSFIYISMSDLIPELHKENSIKKSIIYFAMFVSGLIFMYFSKILFE